MKSGAKRTHQTNREDPAPNASGKAKTAAQRLFELTDMLQKLQLQNKFLYADPALEDKTTPFRAQLDLIQAQIREEPKLRSEFARHALFQDQFRLLSRSAPDEVAMEIAIEAPMMWNDRKKAPYSTQPWAWLKRPDLFIVHVYKKWHDAGTLELRHLTRDPHLHAAYRVMIGRHPKREIFARATPTAARRRRP